MTWCFLKGTHSYCLHCKINIEYRPLVDCPYKEHARVWERKRIYLSDYVKNHTRNVPHAVCAYKLRVETLMFLGGKCVVCGETDVRILQINHKNGGGAKDYKKYNSTSVYSQILHGQRNKDDYDVRCANHNILYEFEVGRRKDWSKYPNF